MGAGQRRERVELQSPPTIDDDAGGTLGPWILVAELWAGVEALKGEASILNGVDAGVVTYRVTINARPVTSAQRFVWKGLALDVRSVLPSTNRAQLTIICEAARV